MTTARKIYILQWLAMIAGFIVAVLIVAGCAATAEVAELRTEIAGVKAQVNVGGTHVGDVEAQVGDIGGGVDTITTVAAVLGLIAIALSLPVFRYLRLKLSGRKHPDLPWISRDDAIRLLRGGAEGVAEWNRRRREYDESQGLVTQTRPV